MYQQFLKVINPTNPKAHNGYAYKLGLNLLNMPFQPKGSCVAGGFYFTTPDYISNFYGYGTHLADIKLPFNDTDFKMIRDPDDSKYVKYRSNMLIINQMYPLSDTNSYTRFGFQPDYKHVVRSAIILGDTEALDKIKDDGIIENIYSIESPSAHGRTNILEWFKTNGFSLNWSKHEISKASANGHVAVLEWWKNNGHDITCNAHYVNAASIGGHINVLRWWVNHCKDTNQEFTYSSTAVSCTNNIDVLYWWVMYCKSTGRQLLYSEDVVGMLLTEDTKVSAWWNWYLKNEVQDIAVCTDNINMAIDNTRNAE